MKKALIVTTVSGFVPQFELNNVHLLQELGYEVHYASNFQNVSYGKDNKRLEGTGIVCHQVDFERSPFAIKQNRRAFRQLKQIVEQEAPELVHCHTPVGAALTRAVCAGQQKMHKLRVIYTAHGFHFYKGAPFKYWLLFYPVERWLARCTDVLITINKEDYERAKRFSRRKRTKVEYVPGVGIDMDYWSGRGLLPEERQIIRERVRKDLGVSTEEKMLLSVGELIPRKNHLVVIEALAEKPPKQPYKYFICGQGVLHEELEQQIKEKGLSDKVVLLGYREDIRSLLYAADLFVFPSKQEGLPVALLEAMAAGTEVAASDIRGNRDLLELSEGELSDYDRENVKKKMQQIYKSLS